MCDQAIETFEAAHVCVVQYATRWFIEEFHKALKSGMGVQRLQLKTAHRLFAVIALLSVAALRLLELREHLRAIPDLPADQSGLEVVELEVLQLHTKRNLTTLRDVTLDLGRQGGHLNRKGDGMPGWQVLWRGMQRLQTMIEGIHLANQLKHKFGQGQAASGCGILTWFVTSYLPS